MQVLDRIANAFRGERGRRPQVGALLRPRRADTVRDYPADGLTPQRLIAIMREADGGSLSAQMELYEQMEEKDAHLFSVANTRRLAVTSLPWDVVSGAEIEGRHAGRVRDPRLAEAAATFCDVTLRSLPGFEESQVHLALAIGRNVAVAEMVWEATGSGLRLRELVPVDFGRLVLGDLDEIRLLTGESDFEGIELPPDKFIVHAPHAVGGHSSRGGLLRVTSLAFLAKHFAIKDWLIFAEVFGMPVRIARYAPNASVEEKRELIGMLKQLGADATAIFSKAVDIEIKQTRVPGETNLYENLCLYFDREISKAWLGQTLTTDVVRARASAGVATVHERVRQDLRDDDLRKEARTIRRDLLAPMVRMAFGADAPVPFFRRRTDRTHDPELLSRVLSVAVNQLGIRVPVKWAHSALGLPEAVEGEAVLPGSSVPGGAGGVGDVTERMAAASVLSNGLEPGLSKRPCKTDHRLQTRATVLHSAGPGGRNGEQH